MVRVMRRLATAVTAVALAAGAAMSLTGCASQIGGLAPVGGDTRTGVRNAVIDVLLDKGIDVLVAPKCTEADTGYSCKGSTTDGKEIIATGSNDDDPKIVIVVGGGEPIFTGTMQGVLDAAAQATS